MPRGHRTQTEKHGARKNRRVTTQRLEPERQTNIMKEPIHLAPGGLKKYAEIAAEKVNEFRRGRLYNVSGRRVGRYNQAISVAQREAIMEDAPDVPGKKKKARMKRAA